MALDHGILNLPLNKRGLGNIDAEIDRFNKQQREAKAEAMWVAKDNYKTNKAAALEALKQIDSTLLKAQADKRNMKPRELLKLVKEMCNDKPKVALKVIQDLFIAKADE